MKVKVFPSGDSENFKTLDGVRFSVFRSKENSINVGEASLADGYMWTTLQDFARSVCGEGVFQEMDDTERKEMLGTWKWCEVPLLVYDVADQDGVTLESRLVSKLFFRKG